MKWRVGAALSPMLAALYGCGEVLAEPRDDATADGGIDSPSGTGEADAPGSDDSTIPVTMRCDREKAFGTPSEVKVSGRLQHRGGAFQRRTHGPVSRALPRGRNKVACDFFQSPYVSGAFGSHTKMVSVSSGVYDSYPTVTAVA